MILPCAHYRQPPVTRNFGNDFPVCHSALGNKFRSVARGYTNCWRLWQLLEAVVGCRRCLQYDGKCSFYLNYYFSVQLQQTETSDRKLSIFPIWWLKLYQHRNHQKLTADIAALSACIAESSTDLATCFMMFYKCFLMFNNVLLCLVSSATIGIGASTINNCCIGDHRSPITPHWSVMTLQGSSITPRKWSHSKLRPEWRLD